MLYKVEFKNGVPVSAVSLNIVDENGKLEYNNDEKTTRFMYLDAENETRAIEAASKLFKNIWGDIVSPVGY